ncbi:MAG: aldehyde ferredoxin oxidoreductase [Rhodospirillaceae bacterium]|mgnify:FL=1|nr:aldehyde ferredoxin oxidoreductase [Rhodospirillaceae bacterium]
MAWHGKLLRVNLTKGTCTPEALNMDWVKLYLGQRGLGTKYLFEEIDPKVDPLSPDNKLIFVTGPLTGTCASTGGRYSVVTKGPLTGTVACSNSGGQFGGELKQAGWDMLIVEGKSPKPVYLMIVDGEAELIDADGFLWGETVWDTEDLIKQRHQDPLIRIASIGGAGEGLSRYACIMNDRDRAAGRSGVGAVMGSKLLKAVAVRGTTGVAVNDPKRFLEVTREKRKILDPSPARARYSGLGTMAMMDVTQAHGSLPTMNCRDVQFEHVTDVNVKAQHTARKTDGEVPYQGNKACFACSIGCGRMAKIDPDHFSVKGKARYQTVTGGLEYESAYAVGPMCGVQDLEAATYASALCNEHGMDPISFGATVAAAMELFEEGAITLDDTEGHDFSFGNAEALCWAAEVTGLAQGFGKDLGLGALRLCQKYGRPEFAMVVKGQEFPGYDPRAMQGMALGYATSNRGACHLKAAPFQDDFQRVTPDGKAKIVKDSQDYVAAIDSSGLCTFTKAAWQAPDYADQIDAACDGDWSVERLLELGERIYNLERLFNNAAGFTAADDTLPKRILTEPAKGGAGKGHVAELDKMLPEYYELRGWTPDGEPTTQTLSRLGLA